MEESLRLVFFMPRLNHLRCLGPVAHAALQRGWRVHFLCPLGGEKDDAVTGLAHPDGLFGTGGRLGGATAARVTGTHDTLEWLRSADAVLSVGLRLPGWMRAYVVPQTRGRVQWVAVPYLQEELLQILEDGPARLAEWDVVGTGSSAGVEVLAEELARQRSAAAARIARQSLTVVGMPMLDPLVDLEQSACRRALGWPEGRVLLFVPAARPHLLASWRRWAFSGPLASFAWALRLPSYRRVVAAVLRYANRHGASVQIKARQKSVMPGWLSRVPTTYDESWFPHTALVACRAADAYCGLASAMAVEATAAGLAQTHFHAWPDEAAEHPLFLPLRRRLYRNGGPWGAAGVSESIEAWERPNALEEWARHAPWPKLPARAECDAALRPVADWNDGRASDRLLDALR